MIKKTCSKCHRRLPVTQFYRRGKFNHRGKSINHRPIRKQYHAKCKNCWRVSHLASEFRVSKDEIRTLLQREHCDICGETGARRQMDIDHCHKTHKIRGVLCENCNKGLGHFKDNVHLLKLAIKYLRK